MIKEIEVAGEHDDVTEILLWKSVIARTVQDWLSTAVRPKLDAERYLFDDSRDLSLVCGLAGINVDHLRRCLNKVRGKKLTKLMPIAA